MPVLLARTVAAAPSLIGLQPKDREETDDDAQCLNSQPPEEEMDERARWQVGGTVSILDRQTGT